MPPSAMADKSRPNNDKNMFAMRPILQGVDKSIMKRDTTRMPRFTINEEDNEKPISVSNEVISPSPVRETRKKPSKYNRHDR